LEFKVIRNIKAFFGGGAIGVLGGLVGLGGAEFRLPLLITIFSFTALSAVILNKAMSLIVVGFSLVFRSSEISFALLMQHSDIIFSMLLGSVIGAWFGAGIAVKLKSEMLYKVIGFLLLFIALVLVYEHYILVNTGALFENNTMVLLSGVIVGCGIGVVAAILGVAGGELYIPAIILIYGVDIKLAGSLSLAISLPTMLVAFFRYSQDESFKILFANKVFILVMGLGSIVGAFCGAMLLGVVSNDILIPLLCMILLLSSHKMYKHKEVQR
jgi:uncharacterized membrane protein YfcA